MNYQLSFLNSDFFPLIWSSGKILHRFIQVCINDVNILYFNNNSVLDSCKYYYETKNPDLPSCIILKGTFIIFFDVHSSINLDNLSTKFLCTKSISKVLLNRKVFHPPSLQYFIHVATLISKFGHCLPGAEVSDKQEAKETPKGAGSSKYQQQVQILGGNGSSSRTPFLSNCDATYKKSFDA